MRRAILTLAAVASVAALAVPAALADGDPASDILYFQDVFLPYSKPSADAASKLNSTVSSANNAGYRIKVAVVATAQDLGSIPSLFNRAPLYARFLGTELSGFYKDRLLIVMPAGFGFYRNGASTTKEDGILKGITIGEGPDGLTEAAATAVEKLRAAQVVKKGADSTPPKITALAATAVPGKPVHLRYHASDNSGKSAETVRVYGKDFLLYASINKPLHPAKPGTTDFVVWKVPKKLPAGQLKFCVLAADASGNQSRTSCAPLRIT